MYLNFMHEHYKTSYSGQKQEPVAREIPPLGFGLLHQFIHLMEAVYKMFYHVHVCVLKHL